MPRCSNKECFNKNASNVTKNLRLWIIQQNYGILKELLWLQLLIVSIKFRKSLEFKTEYGNSKNLSYEKFRSIRFFYIKRSSLIIFCKRKHYCWPLSYIKRISLMIFCAKSTWLMTFVYEEIIVDDFSTRNIIVNDFFI